MALSSKKTRDQNAQGNQVGVIRLPKGVDLFKVDKSCTVKMAIIPYTVPVGAKHPVAKDGEMHYSRDYYVHKNVGPSGKESVICPRLTRGERCPICDSVKDQLSKGLIDKETAKKLRPSVRTIYNVWLPDLNKTALFDAAHYGFTEPLNITVSAKTSIPGREWVDYFADPVEGSYIWVTFQETAIPSGVWYPAKSFEFEPHKGLPKDILMAAQPLDSLLIISSSDELRSKYCDIDAEVGSPDSSQPPVEAANVVTPPVAPPVADLRKPAPAGVPTTYPPVASAAPKAADAPVSSPKAEPAAPKAAGLAKGDVVYHTAYGKCTVHKVAGDVVTVMDSDEEPRKVKPADLSATPVEVKAPAQEPQPTAAAEEASEPKGEDEAWDSDWND